MTRFSRFVRSFDLVADPFGEPKQYVKDLASIVRRRKIDILLPVHEDALTIATFRDLLPPDLLIACPDGKDFARANDKYEIIRIAESAGLDVPRTVAPSNLEEAMEFAAGFTYPIVIKTRRGNSGKGVLRVDSPRELRRTYQSLVERFGLAPDRMPILQEYVGMDGGLYGTCFLAEQGQVKACFMEHYLRHKEGTFGTSVLREPCDWPLLRHYTERLSQALSWTGVGHFDFVANRALTRAVFLEMNPRFWGALNLAVSNGYDFPRGLVTMLIRGKPDDEAFRPSSRRTKSLWIIGELIAGTADLRHGRWLAPFQSLARVLFHPCSVYDDFRWDDPLPLIAETLYYGKEFLANGGELNPTKAEMMG
jgi:predicted ATP-grasp superfamily ATP-dependent carboligase